MGKSIKNLSSVTVVGLDIAKNVFQVHGVDAKGATVSAPTSSSINRSAAKPIVSRKTSASGVFSTSARRLIISSVIGGSSVCVGRRNPILPANRR